jgi:hypothetical protein
MPLHRSPVRTLAGFQGNQCASPRVFGAKGDGTTDDLAAIQATINELKALPGGGTMILDGRFRVSDTIEMDSKVSIEGVGSAVTSDSSSALILNHDSHPFFNWGSIAAGFGFTQQRIKNVLLDAAQANSQPVFNHANNHPLYLIVENLTFNTSPGFGLLNGNLWNSAVNSKLVFRDCEFNQTPVAPQLFVGNGDDDLLTLDHCRFRIGSNANSRAIDMQAGNLDVINCDFLIGSTPQAGAAWIHTGPAGITRASHNKFHSPSNDIMPSFTWQAGARLVESNNTYNILTGPIVENSPALFTLSGSVPKLAEGSRISPRANRHRGDGNASVTLDDYVSHTNFEALTATTVTFTMPRIFMPGQHYRLTLKNSTGSSLTTVFTPWNSIGGTITNIASGKYAFYEFIAADSVTLGTYAWYHYNTGYSP